MKNGKLISNRVESGVNMTLSPMNVSTSSVLLKVSILLVFAILLSHPVQSAESVSSMFEETTKLKPPSIEDNKVELILLVRGMEHGALLINKHVNLELYEVVTGTIEDTLRYSGENGEIILTLDPGNWEITAKIDDFATPGKDYISNKFCINLENTTTDDLFMLPVGGVRGDVYNKEGERVVNAEIKLDCERDYGDTNTTTDSFGAFSIDYAPVGSCRIFALFGSSVGFTEINITAGGIKTVNITLTQATVSPIGGLADIFLAIIILVLISIVLLSINKKRTKKEITSSDKPKNPKNDIEQMESAKISVTPKMRDIIETLSEREQKIVNLLIEHGGQLTQYEIRRQLWIPKATVSRDVYSLEQKKIIKSIRIGRDKEVKLTGWFLGEET